MAKDNKKISKLGAPDQAASDKVKATEQYGNAVANYIAEQWFYRDGSVARFYDSREEFERLRSYARGAQSTEKYKKELNVDGDLSYLNLDWEPVPIIPKFVDVIVNGMQDRLFDVTAYAQDKVATTKRKEDLETLKGEMENKDALLAIQEASNVPVFENDPDTLPRSQDELDVYINLNYKQKVEIAAETAVNQVFDANDVSALKKRINRDITEIGIGVAKHSFDPEVGVKIEYVDPVDFVWSYNDDPEFKDMYYAGEVRRISISSLQQMFPHLTPSQIDDIKKVGGSHYRYHNISYDGIYNEEEDRKDPNHVDILFFCWKTTRKEIFKVRDNNKGGKTAIQKDDSWNPPQDKRSGYERTERHEEVIYEGIKVLGDNEGVLKWEIQKNMIRPKSSEINVAMPYVASAPNFFKGRFDSMVKRMTKPADLAQLTYLKIQQAIQKVTPPGVYLDADGLAEIDLGNGTEYNAREALKMYFQTGSVIGRSQTKDGERNPGAVPIQELPGSTGQQLQALIGTYQYYLDQVRVFTGVNEIREGQKPDERALFSVQKLAAANSNTATRHILDACLSIMSRVADGVTLRLQDVLEHSKDQNPNLRENLINSIGKRNTAIIETLEDYHLHDFGIFLELTPDDEEKALIEQNIQQALAKDRIFLDDAIDVREIRNLKLANQVLKYKRQRKEEKDRQQELENIQAQADANAQAAQAKAQAEAQAAQIKAQSEIQVEEAKSNFGIQKLEAEKRKEIEILYIKHDLQMDIVGASQLHENFQNDKKNEAGLKQAAAKQSGGASGPSSISLGSKANTIDGKIGAAGALGD